MDALLALDQGTSSSRALVFDRTGRLLASAQRELTQHYPQPGWVEHDAGEIWSGQLACAREALAATDAQVVAIGITNQRETTVLWDRKTGEPLHRALVWQDRRTAAFCETLKQQGAEPRVRELTGLVLDPYFSATKLRWLLDHVPGARERAARGELAFGTVDSWLLWQLSGGRVHATDPSNASRTLLFDIHRGDWSDELLGLFDIPRSLLPEVRPSAGGFGHASEFGLPITGIAGDQQAALFGQAALHPGQAKNTYGTGCFLLMHTGTQARHSTQGLVTTRAAQAGAAAQFALEGSVFVGGAVVQWLRDGLRAIGGSGEVQALAESVPDAGGVMFVPAFAGLGAPYWRPDARGALLGLTRGTTQAHIARAALESIAFQSAAVLAAMNADVGANERLTELRVDGGASANDLLMQFQADLLGIPVLRPRVIETTALGAALLAGLGAGLYASTDEIGAIWQLDRDFAPRMSRDEAGARQAQWDRAVRQVLAG
ncbi:MAG: glycerol kinase GlpK [Proteobacteria bacterium]|jgi:glycerol kinase|nr:glycerol kinase [Methylibium sp.]MBY0368738.1 glycerol kinase GlpK [Burkholderiaceae bacterium]MCH8854982.1 glycerol kinase GlpK [Pseudomonadota bacterium]|mmetsp:Transcript_11500/g.46513  ORF Transcript_11500/g.46513 Transcript_11500/m.46513 type:complete len:489 (-) Transcript_11500:831-2297(-)